MSVFMRVQALTINDAISISIKNKYSAWVYI